MASEKSKPTKAHLVRAVKDAFPLCDSASDGLSDAQTAATAD